MTKKIFALILTLCLGLALASCGKQDQSSTTAPSESTTKPSETKTTEAPTTEPTSTEEEPTEEPVSGTKPVILAVSFGTSYNDNRELSIGGIEAALQEAFPEYEVRRAFTAQTVIDILAERDGIEVDNVVTAMARLIADGVTDVVVQPTHVMPGFEYDDVIEDLKAFAPMFDSFKIGKPLLSEDSDFDKLANILAYVTADYVEDSDTAIVFMGHGTEHPSNAVYQKLNDTFPEKGYENFFVGTVEATPSLEDVIEKVKESGAKKVILHPLMIVAGDHANNDMAGDEEDSWKSAFEAEGFEVECILTGLGQYAGIQEMIVEHCKETIEAAKPVILAVSFGTSYNDSREKTIGAIETYLQMQFPQYEVRRAFTSQIIIDKLKERDGIEIDNVSEAMARLIMDGVKDVIIQPTHIMAGYEYDDVVAECKAFASSFNTFKISKQLLYNDEDYEELIKVLENIAEDYEDEADTAVVFMGHGTEHPSNTVYKTLQDKLTATGHDNIFIGTVEATPSLEDVMELLKAKGAKKVVLHPLMIVAGDHANNDMAGDEEDSWKTILEEEGYEVECLIHGLGEYEDVWKMIARHCEEAINPPTPVTASMLKDGSYEIQVDSSATMFRVVKCVLNVTGDEMTATMTMSGQGYGMVFLGTGEEALEASEDTYVQAVKDAEGKVTFTVPLKSLNTDVNCAAWSIKNEKWYDRVLVFKAASLPETAYQE